MNAQECLSWFDRLIAPNDALCINDAELRQARTFVAGLIAEVERLKGCVNDPWYLRSDRDSWATRAEKAERELAAALRRVAELESHLSACVQQIATHGNQLSQFADNLNRAIASAKGDDK